MTVIHNIAFRPWRALRPEEERVQFGEIDDKISRASIRFHTTLRRILGEVKESAIQKALKLEDPTAWSALKELAFTGDMKDYRNFLTSFFVDVYSFGKRTQADELRIVPPQNSPELLRWIESKSQSLAALHASVLQFRVQSVLLGAPTSPAEKVNYLRRGIGTVFENFANQELDKGGELVATLALQAGREETIGSVWHRIVSFTWSAILDNRVCNICAKLDGVTWGRDDPTIIRPPIHLHDRCVLVAVGEADEYKPEITGTPKGFALPKEYQSFVEGLGRYRRGQ